MGEMDLDRCLHFCDFPEYLRDEILAWLPVQDLCRFRCVCREWNALISSSKFITTNWAEKPPNRNPCLVVQWLFLQKGYSLAYCFFTGTWKKNNSIFLSFPLRQELETEYPIRCYGSARGLLLVGAASAFVVSNPLTRTSLQLPQLPSIRRVFAIGIVGGDSESRDTYKVVVMGKSNPLNEHIVEIYNSTDKLWRIAGHLREDVQPVGTAMGIGIGMVFCEGSFYCLTITNGGWGITGFSLIQGTSIFAPLPEMVNGNNIYPYMLVCNSRLLVIGGIVKNREELLQEVIVWEFEEVRVDSSSSLWWKVIARMPPSMREGVNRSWSLSTIDCPFMCCVGIGDCACFIVCRGMHVIEVVVYSVSEETWGWLPSYLLDDTTASDIWAGYVMAFESRPDMKVA